MARRATPLETLRMFVATSMELVALGDAIHYYINAAQCGQLPEDKQKQVVSLLESFQSRLVAQIEGRTHHDESI